jgi:hypothetical protein
MRLGICVHQYIDDWLNTGPFREEVIRTTQALLYLVEQLGWLT